MTAQRLIIATLATLSILLLGAAQYLSHCVDLTPDSSLSAIVAEAGPQATLAFANTDSTNIHPRERALQRYINEQRKVGKQVDWLSRNGDFVKLAITDSAGTTTIVQVELREQPGG